MDVDRYQVVRGYVKALLALLIVSSTCGVIIFFGEAVSGEGLALLGTLAGAIVTHYFQRDDNGPK